MARIELPAKLEPLWQAARYKVLYGGRGGTKSWGIARTLLLQGWKDPIRVLCARETQRSIRDSVHRLLSDQIIELGLTNHYEVQQTEIRGINGTVFIFAGLSALTVDSIKSFEGADRCWVEEGQTVTKRSWSILIPTIRKAGSEIWISFNPDLDTDDTYVRFIENTPPNSILIPVSWRDNPWLTQELRDEMEHLKRTDQAEYENVWEGHCRPAAQGAIYTREMTALAQSKRVCNLPADEELKTHSVWDLGFNDQTSIIIVQTNKSELRIVDYIEDNLRSMTEYGARLKALPYNWGTHYLPWDGSDERYKLTGQSPQSILRKFLKSVEIVPKADVEMGIKKARVIFGRCYFDREKTVRLRECLKRYKRIIPPSTDEPATPMHDEFCLHPHELVWTRYGMCPIMDLPEKGEVMTSCGFKPYVNPRITRRNAPLVEVRFKDGSTVRCTPEHLFKTANGWRSAEELQTDSQILSCSIPSPFISMGISIGYGLKRITTRAVAHVCTVMYGSWLLGLFRWGVTSITEMETQKIIALPTSNVYRPRNIFRHLGQNDQPIHRAHQHCGSLQNGIDLKLAEHGTAEMPEKLKIGRNGKGLCDLALFAAKNLWDWIANPKQRKSIAVTRVKPALIESVTPLIERVDTWCLDVPEVHEFCLANGAIVHNSHGADAFRYLAMVAEKLHNNDSFQKPLIYPKRASV